MRVSISVNTTGGQRKVDVVLAALSDLAPALKALGKHLRKRAQERFDAEGPGWPRLAASTLERREERQKRSAEQHRALAVARMRRRLRRELRRAQSKMSFAAALRRHEVLKEFERIVAGGGSGVALITGDDRERVARKLRARLERAEAKASSKVLGRMASSITASVSRGRLVVRSKIAWSGAHNEGDTVGHGAVLPARTFLMVEESDVDLFITLVIDYALAAV